MSDLEQSHPANPSCGGSSLAAPDSPAAQGAPAGGLTPEVRSLIEIEVSTQIARHVALLGVPGGHGGPPAAGAMAGRLSIREMVARMPNGLRSESSIRRGIGSGIIPARKFRGQWSLDPAEVEDALLKTATAQGRTEIFAAHWEANRKAISVRCKWPRKTHTRQPKAGP